MNLYYTTTVGYDSPQPNSDRSLGGYKSSTKVVNDDFGNLFDELSVMTMKNNRDEYRAIILRNDYDTPVAQVKVNVIISEDAICSYKMAIGVLNGKNKYNQKFMENVETVFGKPFHAKFVEMTADTILEIGRLNPGDEVGLWVCRHVDIEAARHQFNDVCEPDPKDPTGRIYRPITYPTTESVDIAISWI